MTLGESLTAQGDLPNDLAGIALARINEATPIETLSDRDYKLLRVMEDSDGSRFVTRSYTPQAIRVVERRSGSSFEEAWKGMHEVCDEVGIDIARGHFIRTGESEFPIIAINEYLEDVQDFKTASTEAKKLTAISLGSILTSNNAWALGAAMVQGDMFGVRAGQSNEDVVLQDVDPYVVRRNPVVTDAGKAWYLGRLGELFWDEWCEPEEREEVFVELVKSVVDVAAEEEGLGEITRQFQVLHLMSNGLDTRELSAKL